MLESTGFSNIALLHIDIDGNDYHILKEIDLSKLDPAIIIMEYNSVFGKDRKITVPYDRSFVRTKAHFSN
ncbi:MAG: FkbM family methyltransferase [Deltaproteobacteria bacterium]